jgi:hypothetical protein
LEVVFEGQGDCVAYLKEHMPKKGSEKVKRRKGGREGGGGEEEEEEVEVPMYDYVSFVSHIFGR